MRSLPATMLMALLAGGTALAQGPPGPGGGEAEMRAAYARLLQKKLTLEREKRLKELQLSLAESDAPYMVVDLEDRAIRIFVRVVEVQRYPLLSAEMEGERGLFAAGEPPPDWVDRIYELAAKSGPRQEPVRIEPPAPGQKGEEVDPRSVTPDKIGLDKPPDYPGRYTLLFKEGLAVSLGGQATRPEERGWVERKLSRLASLVLSPEMPEAPGLDRPAQVWVHAEMPATDAQALYPSLYAGMRAMVRLPGDPRL